MLPDGTKNYTRCPDYEEEVSTSERIQRTTYTLGDRLVVVQVKGYSDGSKNGRFYMFNDQLGAVSYIVGSGGQLRQDIIRYGPFGGYRGDEPSDTNPDMSDRGFTGQKHENELDLIYYNARWYMPGLGRFLSADTIVPDPKDPQSFNRYSYVKNNAINFTDPSGHCEDNGDENCWALWEELHRKMYDDSAESIWGMDKYWDHLGQLSQEQLSDVLYFVREGNLGLAILSSGRPAVDSEADYYLLEISGGIWAIGINGAVIMDQYENIYGSFGGNLGKSFPTFISGRWGNGWMTQDYEPSEGELQKYLTGLSVNIGGGWLPGANYTTNLKDENPDVGYDFEDSFETGIYSPHIGISTSWSIIIRNK